jgi:hypothetical protein
MLRARLLTSLVFNLCIAAWVLADARARGARKPGFAAMLALMWGPLGLGFWESDRPLARGETRPGGGAASFARGFLRGWVAMLPAVAVLVHAAVEHRAAVPGSLGRDIGLLPATGVVLSMAWGLPVLLAAGLVRFARTAEVERGTAGAGGGSVSATTAAATAGIVALAAALMLAG